jgi:hypothetical protein
MATTNEISNSYHYKTANHRKNNSPVDFTISFRNPLHPCVLEHTTQLPRAQLPFVNKKYFNNDAFLSLLKKDNSL